MNCLAFAVACSSGEKVVVGIAFAVEKPCVALLGLLETSVVIVVIAFMCLSLNPGDLLVGAVLFLDVDENALSARHFC